MTAIVAALDEEIEPLKNQITNLQRQTIERKAFFTGEINGRRILVASTGTGKVNAAMTTTLVIDHFRPHAVISTGMAGDLNPKLITGGVVIATKTAQHDLGIFNRNGNHF